MLITSICNNDYLELDSSEPKWVNFDYFQYEVNLLKPGGLQLLQEVDVFLELCLSYKSIFFSLLILEGNQYSVL